MSYITILWSSCAAAALLLALLHGLAWIYDRRAYANLAFAVAAISLSAGAVIELGTLHAQTPAQWGNLIWWQQFAVFGSVVGIALFLRLYLRAGRVWLLGSLIALRGIILLLNLVSEPNVNFADLAHTFGLHGEGPIDDPDELAPAPRRAVAMIDQGVGAVQDIVCEPR